MTETAPPPPPPSAPPPPPMGTGQPNVAMIVLAYLWILALVPLLVEKEDREVQWHAKHGLVLTAAEIVIGITLGILSSFLACIGCIIAPLVFIPFLVIRILCIVKGMKGERFIVPGISQFADRF
jgi:uncharacterized membrane protein